MTDRAGNSLLPLELGAGGAATKPSFLVAAAVPAIIAIASLLMAGFARWTYGYPWCASGNDELFWATIVGARSEGFFYPISGAAFVWFAEHIGAGLGWLPGPTIALMGWVSIVPLVLLTFFTYRRWVGERAGLVLLVLATTAYFWTPLIESKPQQWGQPIALLGVWLCLAVIRRRTHWGWLLLCASILAWVHILSFAIMLVVSAWAWLALTLRGRVRVRDGLLAAAAFVPGLVFIIWPGGPYGLAISAVLSDHIQNGTGVLAVLGSIAVLVPVSLRALRVPVRSAPVDSADPLPTLCRSLSAYWMSLLAGAIVACLAFQAILLPETYWFMYGNSLLQFAVAQSGNVLFLLLTLYGVWLAKAQLEKGSLPEAIDDSLVLVVGCGIIGLLGLGVTVSMLDNNWFLRVAGYTVMFAAPLAAHAASKALMTSPKGVHIALGAASIISLLLAVRWPGLVGCEL